jgi:hypothetical protein
LSPNLVTKDYGLDFICQILQPIPGGRVEEVHGALLAAQVRGTEGGARPRIKLYREDVENLLRQDHAVCVIALNPSNGPVAFRFLDEAFAKTLEAFRDSTRQSMTLRLDEMDTDPGLFDRTLIELRRPGTQYRMRIDRVRRQLARSFPGSNLSIRSDQGPLNAFLKVPWIGSIFNVATTKKNDVRKIFFETGQFPSARSGISMRPEILSLRELADGDVVVAGIGESDATLQVESEDEKAGLTFSVRRLGDEFAYTHEVGLTLVHSDGRYSNNEWIHELEVTLFPGEPLLKESPAVRFLRLLTPRARIDLGRGRMPLRRWGGSLTAIGPSIAGLLALDRELNIGFGEFRLNDLKNEEVARTLAFANALFVVRARVQEFVPGFLLNSVANADPKDLPSRNVSIKLPIALNFLTHGIIVWVDAEGVCYLDEDGRNAGLQFTGQLGMTAQLHDRFEKSVYPEVWIDSSMPPLKIGAEEISLTPFRAHENPAIKYAAHFEDRL